VVTIATGARPYRFSSAYADAGPPTGRALAGNKPVAEDPFHARHTGADSYSSHAYLSITASVNQNNLGTYENGCHHYCRRGCRCRKTNHLVVNSRGALELCWATVSPLVQEIGKNSAR
jgi:hypothetical protein